MQVNCLRRCASKTQAPPPTNAQVSDLGVRASWVYESRSVGDVILRYFTAAQARRSASWRVRARQGEGAGLSPGWCRLAGRSPGLGHEGHIYGRYVPTLLINVR